MIYVVVPTYKEIENISQLLEGLKPYKTIIVDDNSSDGTAEAAEGRAIVIRRPNKLGIGSAVLSGMQEALLHSDCQHIVTMDADLSHNPKDIPRLLVAAIDGVGLVQGSRYIDGGGIIGWGFYRRLQSKVANSIASHLFNLPNEVSSDFRVYSKEGVQAVINEVSSSGYAFVIAAALAVKDRGLKIVEVPTTFTNRTRGKSKLSLRDTFIWLLCILKLYYTHIRNKRR